MRRVTTVALTGACLLGLLAAAGVARAGEPPAAAPAGPDLGRSVLGTNDGWGAYSTGTTGGAAAAPENVHIVRNRAELIAALGGNNATNGKNATPKVVYVKGTIRGNVDDRNTPLTCDDYADPGYTREAYLSEYAPETWGKKDPAGPLEEARARSAANQAARIRINVGSNTTIVGLGRNGARIIGVNLMLNKVDNVILRNLEFQDAADCFPQWDPTDGALGNWNSEYDNVSALTTTHLWVDHCTFSDGTNRDSEQPVFFGRPYQVHDGLLDITKGSDFATVSWNVFRNHGKGLLLGSTNNPVDDRGKLRITVHHNFFEDIQERAPRVRFGKVHVYNNHYLIRPNKGYVYSLGVGVESQIYAQNNSFVGAKLSPSALIYNWGGKTITAVGSLVNGEPVDLVAAFNATRDPDLGSDAGWQPTLHGAVDQAEHVRSAVLGGAGRGKVS